MSTMRMRSSVSALVTSVVKHAIAVSFCAFPTLLTIIDILTDSKKHTIECAHVWHSKINYFLTNHLLLFMPPTGCTNQMDVAFVLDFSGSLDDVLNVTVAFTRHVVQGLPFSFGRTRVSVISYSDTATLHFDLSEYQTKREVLNALSFR